MEAHLRQRRDCSLAADIVVEVLLALGADGAELVLSVLLEHPGRDQVALEDRGVLVHSCLRLGLGQLVLELVDPSDLGPDGILLVEFRLIVVLDLPLGPSSLALMLEQIGADAVLDYKI